MADTQSLRRPACVGASALPPSRHELDVLQFISDGYIALDRSLCIRAVNTPALQLAGRTRSEMVGAPIWHVFPDLDESSVARKWTQAMRDGRPASAERVYGWSSDGPICVEINGLPTADGIALLCCDVTRRDSEEAETEPGRAALLHQSRLHVVGTMAGALAHELSQPLTSAGNAVAASLALLKRDGPIDLTTARDALELARSSVQRTGDLVKRVRAFIARGQMQPRPHDLESLIIDASVLIFPKARLAGVEIGFALDRRTRSVNVEPLQIQQVLVNLIEHAIEAMADAPEPRVFVSTRGLSAREVEVAIESGSPRLSISSEACAREPNEDEDGLGLGLAISRTIVHAHGGRMWIGRSAVGGASFRFTLPCSLVSPSAQAEGTAAVGH